MSNQRLLFVMKACVAAFVVVLLAGCSSAKETSSPTAEPSGSRIIVGEYLQQTSTPDGTDMLKALSSTEKLPGMDIAAQQFGVGYIVAPKDAYLDKGYVGVGPFGSDCVLVMVAEPGSHDSSQLALIIAPRYSSKPGKIIGVGAIEQLAPYAKQQTAWCNKPA